MLDSAVRKGIGLLAFAGMVPAALALDCRDRVFYDGFEASAPIRWQVAIEVSAIGPASLGRSATFGLDGLETLSFDSDGTASFERVVVNGDGYRFEVASQPATGGVCVLENASGTVSGPVTVRATCDSDQSVWDRMIRDEDSWQ
jgi:hypothetical protein